MKLRTKLMIMLSLVAIYSSITVWGLVVVIDNNRAFVPPYGKSIIIAILITIILLITVLVANYFSKSLSNPIKDIRTITHKIASNEFDITLNIKGDDEVEDLAKDIEHMSRKLKKSYDRLKSESDMKNQFINIVAHELRSPIQPILSYIGLIKDGLVEKEEAFKIIDSEGHRLQKLANDILDSARIESDTFDYHMQKIKINDKIHKVSDSLRPTLNKDVELELKLEDNVQIIADPDRLYQMFANILSNAIKFTKKGKIKIKTHLLPQDIEIEVSDTGGGIPQGLIPRLFEKFATRTVGAEQSHGTGLGLFISKAIVAAHKGNISAYNNDQGGATFTIVLPIAN